MVLHPARLALEVVQSVAPQARAEPPQLRATEAEVEAEAAALRRLGVDLDAPFRVFVWTDPADNRAWRPGAMARSAARSEAPVVWLAGPAEAHLDDPPGAIVLRHGRGEVRRLLALGEVVRRARGEVVGPDQGASHVLAAAGAPTAVLFGPQDPAATAPQAARVVRCDPAPACMPCRSRTCDHPQGPVCMAHEL